MSSSGCPTPLQSPSRHSRYSKEETLPTRLDEDSGTEPIEGLVLESALLESNASLVRTDQASGYGHSHASGFLSPNLKQVANDTRIAPGDSHNRSDATDGNTYTEEDAECAKYFSAAMHRAKADGLDLFAKAPQPSFRSTTPGLHPPHGRATGMVQPPVDAYRLNTCLAKDYFERRPWSRSTVPAPWSLEGVKVSRTAYAAWGVAESEDRRSLETVARQRRNNVIECSLAKCLSPKGSFRRPASVGHDGVMGGSRPHSRASGYSHNSRPASRACGRSSRRS